MEVARRIRGFSNAYIIMVTARDEEIDKLAGLSAGADDYLTKPFSLRELSARLDAMLRRPRRPAPTLEVRREGDLEIDVGAREVRLGGRVVDLTPIEFDLLDALSAQPRVAFTREQLLELVWGPNWHGDDHVVTVHMSSLRLKLSNDPGSPRFIVTVRGAGYRFGS